MKVRELIEALKKEDPEADVYRYDYEFGLDPDVRVVQRTTGQVVPQNSVVIE